MTLWPEDYFEPETNENPQVQEEFSTSICLNAEHKIP